MKINKKTIIILLILSLLILLILSINEIFWKNYLLQNIIINILCGCFVSIVMCYVNYFVDRDNKEKIILQQLENYYNYLFNLYTLSNIMLNNISNQKEENFILLKDFLKLIKERNDYYYGLDKQLSYFVSKNRKKLFLEVNSFSNGIELYNKVSEKISCKELDIYTFDEVFEDCSVYSYKEMKKIDQYMEKMNNKKYINIDWKKIKKEELIGFFDDNGEVI